MAVRKIWLVIAAALLATSAAASKRDEIMLAELVALLPGSYDNIAQSRVSGEEHPALRLMVVPVQAPLVGDHVFYVQEMAADDPRRVFAQKLYVVNPVPGHEQATLTQLDFNEPVRWRDGHLNRDLFRSLLMQDLRLRAGCDLLWSRKGKEKASFIAINIVSACRTASRTTGETLRVEQRMELNAESLAVFEQHRDATGTTVYGVAADPFFRFSRRADAPW
jgi:hypothetical protein